MGKISGSALGRRSSRKSRKTEFEVAEKTTGHKLKVGFRPSYEYTRTTKKVPKEPKQPEAAGIEAAEHGR